MSKGKPQHNDIELYGYDLFYSESTGKWYASCDIDKGTAWYAWSGIDFCRLYYNQVPDDLF